MEPGLGAVTSEKGVGVTFRKTQAITTLDARMKPRTHTSAMDTLGVHDGPGHCRSGASLWSYRLLAVSVLLLGLPFPTLQQTGGVNSIGARSYCYSVPDPNLPASCNGVRLASSKNTTQAFRLGDSATSYLELEYVPLRNISEIERIANATNGTVSYTDTALGTFFPKVDVYAVLSMNGSDGNFCLLPLMLVISNTMDLQ
jgi:hypothetical protein